MKGALKRRSLCRLKSYKYVVITIGDINAAELDVPIGTKDAWVATLLDHGYKFWEKGRYYFTFRVPKEISSGLEIHCGITGRPETKVKWELVDYDAQALLFRKINR